VSITYHKFRHLKRWQWKNATTFLHVYTVHLLQDLDLSGPELISPLIEASSAQVSLLCWLQPVLSQASNH
jgi:hypothetical protein